MTTELQTFVNNDFGQITAIEIDGKPWFVAKEISEILGYSETSKMTRRLEDDEKVDRPIWAINEGRYRSQVTINESGLYEAIWGSHMPKAKDFKQWIKRDVLPSIRKTGSYSMGSKNGSPDYAQAKAHLDLELFALERLNCSDSSKLMVTHKVYEDHGVPTKNLPQYTEAVRVTFSAKDLLEKNNCGISTIAFNKLMIAAGFMEEKERSSAKGKNRVKKFKALTEKGLEYGQNDASKQNPRETQAHYYEDSFMELFDLVNL